MSDEPNPKGPEASPAAELPVEHVAPSTQPPAPKPPAPHAPLTVRLISPADGAARAGRPVTIEVVAPGHPAGARFADAVVDWGDGHGGDQVRMFARGDSFAGRTSHAFARPGAYTIGVTDGSAPRVELAITCAEAKA